jgi:apolipoprotein N-acyltransferase
MSPLMSIRMTRSLPPSVATRLWPIVGGLAFAAACRWPTLWWLAWVWLTLALRGLRPAQQGERFTTALWRGFRWGWWVGLAMFIGSLWWIYHVTIPGMLALCLYLSLYPAIWGACAVFLKPQGHASDLKYSLALGALWVGLEWLRATVLTGFPWIGAAVTLIESPRLNWLASFVGVVGLSLLPVTFNLLAVGAFARAGQRRPLWLGLGCGALVATFLLPPPKTPVADRTLQILAVQPNLSMAQKMLADEATSLAQYRALAQTTKAAITSTPAPPDLVLWPEAAIPGYFHSVDHEPTFAELLQLGPALITGADALIANASSPDDWGLHNCLALMHRTPENFALHAKVHLVPFGEFLPLRQEIPLFEKMLGHLIPTNFTRGQSLEPITLPDLGYEVIPLVCFEDTIGDLARSFIRERPQIIVNITNDNWFAESPAAALHGLHARWRAVELQRAMVRCANTGLTATIATDGSVTHAAPLHTETTLRATLPVATQPPITYFARHGHRPAQIIGILGLGACLAMIHRRPRT